MKPIEQDEKPPIGSSWQQLYGIVLILHVLIVIAFYLLTRYYS
jgi:hypothetical protein